MPTLVRVPVGPASDLTIPTDIFRAPGPARPRPADLLGRQTRPAAFRFLSTADPWCRALLPPAPAFVTIPMTPAR
jgi:hypothetical protein